MATIKNMKKEELYNLAISKGFKAEELEGLNKVQLIEICEQADDNEQPEEKKEVVDDLENFDGTEIHVHQKNPDNTNSFIRTYSEEIHGENFLDLAKMFKEKDSKRFFVI